MVYNKFIPTNKKEKYQYLKFVLLKELELAKDALAKAHDGQTMFLHKEANREKINISVLFVHAQDHLIRAIAEKNLIEQISELRKVVNTLSKNS